jgi:hypothetical protein
VPLLDLATANGSRSRSVIFLKIQTALSRARIRNPCVAMVFAYLIASSAQSSGRCGTVRA